MGINKNRKGANFVINVLFVLILLSIFAAGLINTIFFPKEINEYENRYSNKIAIPTIDSILDATFQSGVEDALADQIICAEGAKEVYNNTVSGFAKPFIETLIKKYDSNYIKYKNKTNFFGGSYVYNCYDFERIEEPFKEKANNYNAVFKKYPQIDFYAYYIERDYDINFENNWKLNADNYLFSMLDLDTERKRSFEVENFEEYSKWFYKTDHHWNHIGSYKAYIDIVDFLNAEGEIIEKGKEIFVADGYMGSKAERAGSNILAEPFYAYEFDFPEFVRISGGEYGAQKEFFSGTSTVSISYGAFYGVDEGELIFDTGLTDRENILVIGESYDNAILKLLATHYNKTYSIDLRNFEHYTKTNFNFDEYIKDKDIDKVLFIGNIDFYHSNTFKLES